jgi:hypothetical protein
MNNLEIGPLNVALHRTVKVKDNNESSNLPPSLGNFEIHKVSDFKNCPENWDKDGFFIAMHSKEAMWLSFQNIEPVAVMIGAGTINVINGKEIKDKLEKDNYLVTPPQPWLDGWKSENEVYQFVATEIGENKTVAEQMTNTKEHALTISVFKAKNPEKLKCSYPILTWGNSEAGGLESCCFGLCGLGSEMGVGKGGKIKQKIYEDPHGLEEWMENPTKTVKVYLINASEFCEITGRELPPMPTCAEEYNGSWFGLDDSDLQALKGKGPFTKLKNAV